MVGGIMTFALLAAATVLAAVDGDVAEDLTTHDGLPDLASRAAKAVYGNASKSDNGGPVGDLSVTTPTPRFSADPARELQCTEQPGESGGVPIDCQAVCEAVCKGKIDCPCNTKRGQAGCWVPKNSAKRWCADIPNCRVISHFDKVAEAEKPAFFDAITKTWKCSCSTNQTMAFLKEWSQLSDGPVFKQRNFKSVVCQRGNLPLANICPVATVDHITRLSPECRTYVEKVKAGKPISVFETCECMEGISHQSVTHLDTFDYNCSLTSAAKTVKSLMNRCELEPCSQADDCQRCVSYYKPATITTQQSWRLLRDINIAPTVHTCEYSVTVGRCMLLERTPQSRVSSGTLSSVSTCSSAVNGISNWLSKEDRFRTRNATVKHTAHQATPTPTPSRDWYGDDDKRGHPTNIHGIRGAPKLTNEQDPFTTLPYRPPTLNETDIDNTVVGNEVTHRHYVDTTSTPLYAVMTCMQMPDDGVIDEWQLYAAHTGVNVVVQVLRPITNPDTLKDNPSPLTTYRIVGSNNLPVTKFGLNAFPILPRNRLRVQRGDVVGFYGFVRNSNTSYTGIVSWSEGGPQVLFRYGLPGQPTQGRANHVDYGRVESTFRLPANQLVFVGTGISRTYSIAAKGRFEGSQLLIEGSNQRSSPSVSPVPSPSPSTSLSMSVQTDPCKGGPAYWCRSRRHGATCNVADATWAGACTRTPRVMQNGCDVLMRCPDGQQPKAFMEVPSCFKPDRDCEACTTKCSDVWRIFDRDSYSTTSNTSGCPYCMGGEDWQGTCSKGKRQSPVKITWEDVETDESARMYMVPNYFTVNSSLVHTGVSLMLRGDLGTLDVDGQLYDATAVIVHAPAEHQIEGQRRSPVELQVVHKQRFSTNGGQLETLMVSLLFDDDAVEGGDTVLDAANINMAKIAADILPADANSPPVAVVDFDLGAIVKGTKPMVWYEGSATAPPCTEGVTWGVQMGANEKLTLSQVARLDSLFRSNPNFANGRGNNRYTQATNGRPFQLKHNCGFPGAIACPGA